MNVFVSIEERHNSAIILARLFVQITQSIVIFCYAKAEANGEG